MKDNKKKQKLNTPCVRSSENVKKMKKWVCYAAPRYSVETLTNCAVLSIYYILFTAVVKTTLELVWLDGFSF